MQEIAHRVMLDRVFDFPSAALAKSAARLLELTIQRATSATFSSAPSTTMIRAIRIN